MGTPLIERFGIPKKGFYRGIYQYTSHCWWDSDVDLVIKEKRRLWKIWKSGGSKEAYLEAKLVAKKKVYAAKKKAEEVQFANVASDKEDRNQLFKIARQMVKTNADGVGDKCVTNDDGELACTDSEKLSAWKQHYEKLLNTEFPLGERTPGIQRTKIEREWVKVALQKMKDGKTVGTSGIAAELLKAAGDIGVDILTDLYNIQENSIPSRWDVNCFKGKGAALDHSNYRGLRLIEHSLKVFERVIENLLRDKVDIGSMQFGFMPGKGTTDAIFVVRQVQERFMDKKIPLFFAFVDLEKAFDRVPRAVLEWSLRELIVLNRVRARFLRYP